jgi:mannose-6-phosphate isomerase-like protein (cupin superfamily)
MERRNFLQAATLFAPLGGMLPEWAIAESKNPLITGDLPKKISPLYLPPLPPLAHNGTMNIRTWIRSSMTGGVYSSVECVVAPKVMGPPPHLHKELDELMFVLEGTASVMVDGKEVQVEAGGWHLRPRMLTHTFWNATDKPLRFVDMYFNQAFEEFLEQIFFELTPEKGYAFGSAKLEAAHRKLNEKFGLVYAATSGAERQEIVHKYGLK